MPQEAPLYVTCLVAIIFMAIGWGIGFADSNRNSSKKIRAAETKAEIAIKEAENKIADAESRVAAAATIQSEDDPGLLRLKEDNGHLTLEMDGASINTSQLSADQKKRLISILTLMRPWLEGQPAQPVAPRPAAPASVVATSPTPRPTAAVTPTSPAPQPDLEPKPPVPALSIVEQIDSILQSHLANTPFAKQAIRLHESREGGVEVIVGVQKYATVDDVPDPQVKAMIRAAIAEWEEKYTPGL